ncbi:pilus assembly protein [Stieleria sp. TO1_6]|nr:pilus assembly protein [Stieleria tagensis]
MTMCSRVIKRSSLSRHVRRRAVAAVEFAVCLPVLVLLVFGSIEASSFIFLKQSLSVACYEAVREASQADATADTATAKAVEILDSRQVNDFEIRFPDGVAGLERGQQCVCEVSAPTHSNSPLAGDFISNRMLTARVVMLKE